VKVNATNNGTPSVSTALTFYVSVGEAPLTPRMGSSKVTALQNLEGTSAVSASSTIRVNPESDCHGMTTPFTTVDFGVNLKRGQYTVPLDGGKVFLGK